ncbi:Cdc42se2 [Columba livia]|nr:Cdc42se2 [Columba livia]
MATQGKNVDYQQKGLEQVIVPKVMMSRGNGKFKEQATETHEIRIGDLFSNLLLEERTRVTEVLQFREILQSHVFGLESVHSVRISEYCQKRRRRIDRSMIGEPTNFVHTAHVGSGDLFSGMNSVSSIQNQMQSKGGYGGGMSANVQMQLVDTKAG